MKKKPTHFLEKSRNRILISALLFLGYFSSVFAQSDKSPNMIILISESKTLSEFFNEVEYKTNYRFVYSKEDVNGYAKITPPTEQDKLINILDKVLTPLNLTYQFSGNYISISRSTNINKPSANPLNENLNTTTSTNINISGIVLDTNNEPVIGASVNEITSNARTITNIEGRFEMIVPINSKIEVKHIGFKRKVIAINKKNELKITLEEVENLLDEIVIVGYGSQEKITMTGAVVSVKGSELVKVKQPSLKASMLGRVSGLRYLQTNGEPGNDGGIFDIRGYGTPLTIVDGVERPFSQIDPNEIESATILKDASASVYGFRGSNGVIIIETKRGVSGRTQINYNYNLGLQSPVKNLQMMNSYQYAYYRNEALLNAGQTPKFTAEELEKYRTGSDPVNYPNVDWYKETIRNFAPKQQHNLNVSGGSDQIKYFFSLGYLDQESILKSSQEFDRYNFRANVSSKITPRLDINIGLGGRVEEKKYPYYMGDEGVTVFEAIKSHAPNKLIYANNNPAYYNDSDNNMINPVAMLNRDATGYKDSRYMEFNSQIEFSYKIIDNLKVKAFMAYDYTDMKSKEFRKSLVLYKYNPENNIYEPKNKQGQGSLEQETHPYYKTTLQYSADYKTTFNSQHYVSGLLLYEWKKTDDDWFSAKRFYSTTSYLDELNKGDIENQQADGNSESTKYGGLVGRFNYDFLRKYLFEFSFRYDGSYKTSPSHRWGFFPAFSTGWRMSEESFIKKTTPFINNLKLRASWGRIGDDTGLGLFQYKSGWIYPEGGYIFGGGTVTPGMGEANLVNSDIFWYTVQTTNMGFDAELWNGKLSLEFDYFYRKTTGKYARRDLSLPTTSGLPFAQENLNSDDNRGYEFSVGTLQKAGEVNISIKGNVSYSRSKDLYIETNIPLNQYSNYREGASYRYKNRKFGYIATGQFQSYEEIYSSPIQDGMANSSLRPGDIKYKDLNNDGIIDDSDQKIIGRGSLPDLNFGLSMNAAWKNFDVDILFQGAALYTQEANAYKHTFRGPSEGNGFEMWEDRWHKADYNNPESEWIPGKFPSLRIMQSENNVKTSTFWTTNAYYIRLKSIEVGYTLPKSLIQKAGLENIRIYANAYNPFTITNVKYTDPEAMEGFLSFYYPQLKVISFGFNIGI